jgi:hypothetical protein
VRPTTQRKKGVGAKATGRQRRNVMSDELFAELRESVREGAAILRGVREPSRAYDVGGDGSIVRSYGYSVGRPPLEESLSTANGIPNVGALQAQFRLSQAKFAASWGSVPEPYGTGNRGGESRRGLRGCFFGLQRGIRRRF